MENTTFRPSDDEHQQKRSTEPDPYCRALHEILVTRAIDSQGSTDDEIRVELRRAGIAAPTEADIKKVVDARSRGDIERASDNQREGNEDV